MSYKADFSRFAGLSTLPGLPSREEGVKDEAYREGLAAGDAVVKALRLGWAKAPKDNTKKAWAPIVAKYAGDQEFMNDSQWAKGFGSALTGHYGKEMKLEFIAPLVRGAMAVAKSPAGRAALASAGEFAAKAIGRAIKQKVDAKQLSPDKYHDEHGQCPDGFRRNRAGTKCVPVGKTESSTLKADVEESAFHHGTIRQWQNGRHLKNGASWERIKTGRPQQHASKMPTVFDVVQGNVPPDALGPPIASMPSIGVVGASVPEMSVSEATLILQAQLEGEEHFDEDIMKMVFGVLRKVTGRKEPLTIKAATPSGVTPINVYQQLRKSKRTRMAER